MPYSYTHQYKGNLGNETTCYIALYTPRDLVFICTENPANESTSITNMSEYIATDVWHQWNTPPFERFIWIEHYLPTGRLLPSDPRESRVGEFGLATFKLRPPQYKNLPPWMAQTQYPQVLRDRDWKELTLADVEALIEQPFQIPTF